MPTRVLVASLLIVAAGHAASAQPSDAPASAPPAATAAPRLDATDAKLAPAFSARLSGRAQHQFEGDLEEDKGSVSITRAAGDLSFSFAVAERSRLSVVFDTEYSWYDWSDTRRWIPSAEEPWDDTIQHTLGLQFLSPIDDKWAWFAGAGITSAREDGADFGESLTYAGQGGVSYAFNKDFTLSLGLAVRSRLEDEVLPLPIIGINWQINEKLSLSSRRGLGLLLNYDATDTVALTLDAGFEGREFRLDDEGYAREGVGRDQRVPVAAGVVWSATPSFIISGRAGANVWGRYEINDANGDNLTAADADPSAFLELALEFRF